MAQTVVRLRHAKVTLTFFGAAAASSPGPGVHDSAKANEVKGQGQVEDEDPENGEPEDDSMRRANLSPVDAIKFVVPPNGAATRQIIAVLCPSQLPTSHIQTTASQNDTLVCDGGSLAVDAMFTFNVRTVPDPTSGMGGQLFLREDGVFKGPFPVTGP